MRSDCLAQRLLAQLVLSTVLILSVAGAAHAEIRFSTKATDEIIEPVRETSLEDRLKGVLGRDAPEIGMTRSEGLTAMLGAMTRTPTFDLEYTRAFVDAQPAATGNAEWECLTEALYFEARGENVEGIFAVAEVILNRRDSNRFPSTLCGVVGQGTGKKYQCQFSYKCDGIPDRVAEKAAWSRMGKIASLIMSDDAPRDLTGGAQFYHTKSVSPSWSRVFARTTTIGAHHFYSNG